MTASTIPTCVPHDPAPRAPKVLFPAHACDTHAHVCGPAERYPYWSERIYTPPDALLSEYRHMLDTLGVTRAVLIQPSVYGTDNSAMLDAMKADPQRLRGVAVVDPTVSDAELKSMHGLGVRGVRVNIVDVKDRKPGTLPLDVLRPLAARIAPPSQTARATARQPHLLHAQTHTLPHLWRDSLSLQQKQ